MDKSTELHLLQQSILNCTACDLRDGISAPIPSQGSANPKVVIIGPGPSKEQMENGYLWAGRLGYYTRHLLTDAGINPRDVAWVNIVCCGSDPKAAHIEACRLNLRRQLGALDAPYALVLGGVALSALVPFRVSLREMRGVWWKLNSGQWAMAVTHPAATMHKYSQTQEATLKRDLQKFATAVIFGDLHKPKLMEHCLRCERWSNNFVQGIPFCSEHVPHRMRKEKDGQQLNLLGEL